MAKPATGQIVERHGTRGTAYGARFRAYGKRRYVTLDVADRREAQTELENILADVRRGIWREPEPADVMRSRTTFCRSSRTTGRPRSRSQRARSSRRRSSPSANVA
jgi:hypothetical protein